MSSKQKPSLPKLEWIGNEDLAREGIEVFPYVETKDNMPTKKTETVIADKVDVTETPLAEKVLRLYRDLMDTRKYKRNSVKSFNEEIKRIEAEIKDLLKEDVKEVKE